jgi:hypothetical protein
MEENSNRICSNLKIHLRNWTEFHRSVCECFEMISNQINQLTHIQKNQLQSIGNQCRSSKLTLRLTEDVNTNFHKLNSASLSLRECNSAIVDILSQRGDMVRRSISFFCWSYSFIHFSLVRFGTETSWMD